MHGPAIPSLEDTIMADRRRSYIAIDLKSFYASVECVERGLDPLTTNLVVADLSRTEKTICLAVSPTLKAYGLSGRCRLFEVVQKAKEVQAATGRELEYIVATPRMQLYVDYSTRIYNVYLRYVSAEDIHVYSIDEVFMDVTDYLHLYRNPDGSPMTAHELAASMIREVRSETGIVATAGIGTNLYLCKIAMDIVAKHVEADEDGVRIAELDEEAYKKFLWNHRPLTSFWRVGGGISKRLEENGMHTMGDIARMSLLKNHYDPLSYRADYRPHPTDISGEDFLFKLFGIDAELLIDHAWGIEPCTMKDIKSYRPETNCLSSGQVLSCGYSKEKGCLVMKEMLDGLVLDIVERKLVTDQIVIDIGYDRDVPAGYKGPVHKDHYGRLVPEPAHGSARLPAYTNSASRIMELGVRVYNEIVEDGLLVHRLNVTFNHIIEEEAAKKNSCEQIDLFSYMERQEHPEEELREHEALEKEKKLQQTMLRIKGKYGKNAVLRGMSLEEGATMIERNGQIGGHKA